jgi:hypothetical protein
MLELVLLAPLLSTVMVTLYFKAVIPDVINGGIVLLWLFVIIEMIGPGVLDDTIFWYTYTLLQMSSSLYFTN